MMTKELTDSRNALRALVGAMLVGVLGIVAYAADAGGKEEFLTILSVGTLVSGASAFVGGALGFLFGIPRTLQTEGKSTDSATNLSGPEVESSGRHIEYRVNTNLEQISDWLTKILVGVGLTQITQIRDGLVSLTAFAAQGLGPQGQSNVMALALLSYSAVIGFLFGYLWTRLFYIRALRAADEAAIGTLEAKVQKTTERVETTERELEQLKKQSELDAAALNLVYRQLNPNPDLPKVTQEDLNAAVAAAGQPIKVQIFNQSWQIRGENWREANKKPKMERTIPVFKALIKSDVDNRYHMNHGQLGFALKDKSQPEWAEAERELTTAIEIRGPWHEHGWVFYEFNRALCRIMSDSAFIQDQPSDPVRKNQILEDLGVAFHVEELERITRSDPTIKKWISLNNIDLKDLRNA